MYVVDVCVVCMWYECEHACGMYVCGVVCACVCGACVCVGMVSDCFFVFLGCLPIFQGLGHDIVSNLGIDGEINGSHT